MSDLTRVGTLYDLLHWLSEDGAQVVQSSQLHVLVHQHGGQGAGSEQCRHILWREGGGGVREGTLLTPVYTGTTFLWIQLQTQLIQIILRPPVLCPSLNLNPLLVVVPCKQGFRHTYIHIHTQGVHTYTHIHTHKHTHARTYIHTCTHTHTPSLSTDLARQALMSGTSLL